MPANRGSKSMLQLLFFIVAVVGVGWLLGATNLPGAWYAALLCPLSVMGGLPRSHHRHHDPPGTAQNPENRMSRRSVLLSEACSC
jgi:hypothetical protein